MARYRLVVALLLMFTIINIIPGVAAQEIHSSNPNILNDQRVQPEPAVNFLDENIKIQIAVDRTPNEPKSVSMTVTPDIPEGVTDMYITLPGKATVVDTRGFSQRESSEGFFWNRKQDREDPFISMKIPDTATGDNLYDRSDLSDTILIADTDSWAFVSNPLKRGGFAYRDGFSGNSWRYGPMSGGIGEVDYSMNIEKYGNTKTGIAKRDFALFGKYTKHTHQANDRKYELVVAENAKLAGTGSKAAPETPEEIFDILSESTQDLDIGENNEEITVYVLPSKGDSNTINSEFSGIASESETMLTEEAEKSVYVHEYVHLRQNHYTGDLKWLTEASAEYYQHKLPLHNEWYTYDQYERNIGYGLRYNDAVLIEQDGSAANYYKGALAMEKIDRDIRAGSDGSENLQSVLRALNKEEGSVGEDDFYDAVHRFGGLEALENTKSYIQGSNNLEAPLDRDEYNSAFDAQIGSSNDKDEDSNSIQEDTNRQKSAEEDGSNSIQEDTNRQKSVWIEPSISVEPPQPEVGEEVSLSGTESTVRNGKVTDYKWKFESGKSATGPTVQHTYTEPGYHTVALLVSAEQGDSQVTSRQIEVVEKRSETSDEEGISVETPGFGFGSVIMSIVGIAYILKRQSVLPNQSE